MHNDFRESRNDIRGEGQLFFERLACFKIVLHVLESAQGGNVVEGRDQFFVWNRNGRVHDDELPRVVEVGLDDELECFVLQRSVAHLRPQHRGPERVVDALHTARHEVVAEREDGNRAAAEVVAPDGLGVVDDGRKCGGCG